MEDKEEEEEENIYINSGTLHVYSYLFLHWKTSKNEIINSIG